MTEFIRQYLPVLIVGAIIGSFTLVFVASDISLE